MILDIKHSRISNNSIWMYCSGEHYEKLQLNTTQYTHYTTTTHYTHYATRTYSQARQTRPNSGGVAEGHPRFDKGGLQ